MAVQKELCSSKEALPRGLVHTPLISGNLLLPTHGQSQLANNDWYVFKTEPRADAGQPLIVSALLHNSHTVSLLKESCFPLMRPFCRGLWEHCEDGCRVVLLLTRRGCGGFKTSICFALSPSMFAFPRGVKRVTDRFLFSLCGPVWPPCVLGGGGKPSPGDIMLEVE